MISDTFCEPLDFTDGFTGVTYILWQTHFYLTCAIACTILPCKEVEFKLGTEVAFPIRMAKK